MLHISNKDFHFSRGLSRLSNLFNLISCAVLCNIHCCLIHLGSNCIYQAYFNEFPCSRLLQLENYYKVIYNELIESFNGASEVAYSIFTKRILLKIRKKHSIGIVSKMFEIHFDHIFPRNISEMYYAVIEFDLSNGLGRIYWEK